MRFIFTILVNLPPALNVFWCAVTYNAPLHMIYLVRSLFLHLSMILFITMTQKMWYLRKADTGTYVPRAEFGTGANLFDSTVVNRAMSIFVACNPDPQLKAVQLFFLL